MTLKVEHVGFVDRLNQADPVDSALNGRHAAWKYIHYLFGIRHDDYDYDQIKKLLSRPAMAYIKLVACFPERLSQRGFVRILEDVKRSERVCKLTATTSTTYCRLDFRVDNNFLLNLTPDLGL